LVIPRFLTGAFRFIAASPAAAISLSPNPHIVIHHYLTLTANRSRPFLKKAA